jgi:hypothetical protein
VAWSGDAALRSAAVALALAKDWRKLGSTSLPPLM